MQIGDFKGPESLLSQTMCSCLNTVLFFCIFVFVAHSEGDQDLATFEPLSINYDSTTPTLSAILFHFDCCIFSHKY